VSYKGFPSCFNPVDGKGVITYLFPEIHSESLCRWLLDSSVIREARLPCMQAVTVIGVYSLYPNSSFSCANPIEFEVPDTGAGTRVMDRSTFPILTLTI
jgi:hypothetical protein